MPLCVNSRTNRQRFSQGLLWIGDKPPRKWKMKAALACAAIVASTSVAATLKYVEVEREEVAARNAVYEKQEQAWMHCLRGGNVDLGDEIALCEKLPFRVKKKETT